MRMPITAIPSVIKDIAQTFNVETTSLGILTTIPLLCFGLLSSVVSALAQKIGNELTIELAMILMFIGSYLRILNFSSLMIGTILVGAAITCINVLLPAIISDKLPNQIGSVTGMYNVAMTLFAAIGAYAITPITHATSWQTAVIIISIVALIAAIIWVPNLRYINVPLKKAVLLSVELTCGKMQMHGGYSYSSGDNVSYSIVSLPGYLQLPWTLD